MTVVGRERLPAIKRHAALCSEGTISEDFLPFRLMNERMKNLAERIELETVKQDGRGAECCVGEIPGAVLSSPRHCSSVLSWRAPCGSGRSQVAWETRIADTTPSAPPEVASPVRPSSCPAWLRLPGPCGTRDRAG